MSSAVALIAAAVGLAGTLTHDAVANDEAGALLLGLSLLDGFAYLLHVVAVNLLYIPSPCLVLLGGVLGGHDLGAGRELYVVGIVEHDEVVQTQIACNTAGTLRDFLLHAAIRDVGIDGLVHDVAQASLQELGSDGSTHGERVALSEGTAGVLDATSQFALRVTGSHRAPLAQVLQVIECVFADEAQL